MSEVRLQRDIFRVKLNQLMLHACPKEKPMETDRDISNNADFEHAHVTLTAQFA